MIKNFKSFNEGLSHIEKRHCSTDEVEFCVEERDNVIYVLIERIGAPEHEYTTEYVIDNDAFNNNFIHTYASEFDINEYTPFSPLVFYKTDDVIDFLTSIGIKQI